MHIRPAIAALVLLLAAGLAAAAGAGPGGAFGSDIVWRGADLGAVERCGAAPGAADRWSCVTAQMRAAKASAAAIAFAGRLNAMDNAGWADSFKDFGRIALVTATYPFRANTNSGFLLVGGSPDIVDTEQFALSRIDKQRPDYRRLMAGKPRVDLMTEIAFDHHAALAGGAERFVFTDYFSECHACARAATAYLAFDFDAKGRFLGTRLMRVGPPPDPAKS
ncbi:MAG: hypothetical protein ACHP84_10885 [Caulobacterales bacterium]|jgi:hypothetical protein